MDIGILSPDRVSMYTQATERRWVDVHSAPNGAIATCSLLVCFKSSCLATSSIMKEHCEPSSNKMLPWIHKPSALMVDMAVFSRVIVLLVGRYLMEFGLRHWSHCHASLYWCVGLCQCVFHLVVSLIT